MRERTFSGLQSKVGKTDSPRELQQEALRYTGFPTSIKEFRKYLNNLPLEQRTEEGLMFGEDLNMAGLEAADFIFRQTVENTAAILAGRVPGRYVATAVVLTGFGSHDSAYFGLRDYLRNEGIRAIIYHAEAPLNVKPMVQLLSPLTQFLLRIKQEIGENGELDIIAHSKGAILNMAAAIRFPDSYRRIISHSINLGGPIPEWVNSAIGWLYLGWLDYFGGDDFEMSKLLDSVEVLEEMSFNSIGNPDDRIIRGRHIGNFIPIKGSHSGMQFNWTEVLSKIPQILAEHRALAA